MPSWRDTLMTPVRFMTVKTLRTTFGMLERLAPTIGAALAERLWSTVPQGPVRPADPPGHRFEIMVNGHSVSAQSWGDGPAVYLMHGWGGWSGQLDVFVPPLVGAGFKVVALDAPSHGASGPGVLGRRRALQSEFGDALTAAVRAVGPAYAIVGHSAGSAATAVAVLDGLPTERLVLVAPVADPRTYTRQFAHLMGFRDRVHDGLVRRLEKRSGRQMSHFDLVARAAGRTDLPPLLVVHDRKDKEVRYSDGEAISGAWPRAELRTTSGLGHRRILRDPATVTAVVDYLSKAPVTNTAVAENVS
ncbi:alpha/beta fold hydrolase [Micromonospora arida]